MYVVIENQQWPEKVPALDDKVKEIEDGIIERFKAHGVDAIILPHPYRMSYGGVFVTKPEDPNREASEPSRPI